MTQPEMSIDGGVTLSQARHTGDSVDAAALARLHDYMRRAPGATDDETIIARDAFVSGFRYGARWALHTSSKLSDPQFRAAVALLADLFREADGTAVSGWAESVAALERDGTHGDRP